MNSHTYLISDCAAGLGMEDYRIPDRDIFTSSSLSPQYSGAQARLNNPRAWVPDGDDENPYIQIYLGKNMLVTAISTQGHPSASAYVKQYIVKYSINRKTWKFVTSFGNIPKVHVVISIQLFQNVHRIWKTYKHDIS